MSHFKHQIRFPASVRLSVRSFQTSSKRRTDGQSVHLSVRVRPSLGWSLTLRQHWTERPIKLTSCWSVKSDSK